MHPQPFELPFICFFGFIGSVFESPLLYCFNFLVLVACAHLCAVRPFFFFSQLLFHFYVFRDVFCFFILFAVIFSYLFYFYLFFPSQHRRVSLPREYACCFSFACLLPSNLISIYCPPSRASFFLTKRLKAKDECSFDQDDLLSTYCFFMISFSCCR